MFKVNVLLKLKSMVSVLTKKAPKESVVTITTDSQLIKTNISISLDD